MHDMLTLGKQARAMGEDHGWTHANFCNAYGWTEHEAIIPLKHGTPRELLRYLLAGAPLDATPAEFDTTALEVLGEYLAGFIHGIEHYENEHLDD